MMMAGLFCWAGTTTPRHALNKAAEQLLSETGREMRCIPTPIHTATDSQGNAIFYIFNAADGQGFLVVAANDNGDLLGYSTNGTYDQQHAPANMMAWLNSYAAQLNSMPKSNMRKVRRMEGQEPIAPLLTSTWDQGIPTAEGNAYNRLCPTIGDERCVTGCVATAMAQVMFFHRWPTEPCLSIASYDSGEAGTLEELPPTSFQWDFMLPTYYGTETEEECDAIAQLMRYCGQAIKTQYGTKKSEAYGTEATKALNNYFGYTGAHYEKCEDYEPGEWEEMLYTELSASRPVIYFGFSSKGGHAFVCDGTDGNGFFHINWGWGGRSDGYFKLEALTPEHSGAGGEEEGQHEGYSLNQHAIMGIAHTSPSSDIISFADEGVKQICVGNWDADGDGELSKDEAQAVLTLNGFFTGNAEITSFDELQYFTSLTSIAPETFEGCTMLENVTLPESITNIGTKAFADCQNLVSINIPQQVNYIGNEPFSRCLSLTQITVHPENAYFDSRDNSNAIIDKATNTLIAGCQTTIIPETVNCIGSMAFKECASLTTIDIPEGVAEIEDQAFAMCTGLCEANLPTTITYIGNSAFEGCALLTTITLPASLRIIGNNAFNGCTDMTAIYTLNTNPPLCGENAFLQCRAIVYVPNGTSTYYKDADGWNRMVIVEESDNNYLICSDIAFTRSSGGRINIGMRNTDTVIALQFTLSLPKGISIKKDENNKFAIERSQRIASHSLYCNQNGEGTYTILIMSFDLKTIEGNEGNIISIPIEAEETVEAGEYSFDIKNIAISNIIDGNISGTRPDGISVNMLIREFDLGDVNHDHLVNVTDVMLIVNHILRIPITTTFDEVNADVNIDGIIDVIDVMRVVQFILNISHNDEEEEVEEEAEATQMTPVALTASATNQYTLHVDSKGEFTAMQMHVTLPEDCHISDVRLHDSEQEHTATFKRLNDGSYNIVVYHLGGKAFSNEGSALLHINTDQPTAHIGIDNILLTNKQFDTIAGAEVTGISYPHHDSQNDSPTYNIAGQRVKNSHKGIVIQGKRKKINSGYTD